LFSIVAFKTLKNRLIFDKVKAYKNGANIFGPPCIYGYVAAAPWCCSSSDVVESTKSESASVRLELASTDFQFMSLQTAESNCSKKLVFTV